MMPFVTIYNPREFVYSKSLEFSLQQIYERYCAIVGDRVDEKEFFNTLEAEGLKGYRLHISPTLCQIFSDVFLQINDIIIYD